MQQSSWDVVAPTPERRKSSHALTTTAMLKTRISGCQLFCHSPLCGCLLGFPEQRDLGPKTTKSSGWGGGTTEAG